MTARASVKLLRPIEIAPTLRELAIAYVCQCHDVTASELTGPARARHICLARRLFVWIIRTYKPSVGFPTIGRWLNKDNSAIHSAWRKAGETIETDDEFRQECARFAAFYARNGRGG